MFQDAMILRDCTTNTDNLHDHEFLGKRKWDILAIKCCEDFDRKCLPWYYSQRLTILLDAWVVVCVKDVGPYVSGEGPCCCCNIAE